MTQDRLVRSCGIAVGQTFVHYTLTSHSYSALLEARGWSPDLPLARLGTMELPFSGGFLQYTPTEYGSGAVDEQAFDRLHRLSLRSS